VRNHAANALRTSWSTGWESGTNTTLGMDRSRVQMLTCAGRPFLLFLAAFLIVTTASAQVEFVDPAIGGQGFLLEPTRPTVSLPNSMVRVYPIRKDQLDDQIHSFPLTIISHRLGELFWLMPSDGVPETLDHPMPYDQEIDTPECQKGHKKGHENVPFWVLDGMREIGTILLE